MPNPFSFIQTKGPFVRTLFIAAYTILLFFLFESFRRTIQNKEERLFQEKICALLEVDTLPVSRPEKGARPSKKQRINWKKVNSLLQNVKNSDEKTDIMDEIWERRNADYKFIKKNKHKYLLQIKNK